MPVKNFFILQLELKMKKSKRYIKELKLAGYYKYRTNTGKMTASDYTHLFGYLNPYYRSAYNILNVENNGKYL